MVDISVAYKAFLKAFFLKTDAFHLQKMRIVLLTFYLFQYFFYFLAP